MASKDRLPVLNQINYFVEVARQQSYRSAAQQLGVSQPTLTSQIAALEKTLGVTLFERSRSGTQLSPQGRMLLEPAQEVLQASLRFSDLARTMADDSQTTYRLGVPSTLGPYLLPYVLPELHARFAKLKFYVRDAPPLQLEQGLLAGEFDLVISPMYSESSQIIAAELFVEPLKFVIPSDHRLAGQQFIEPADIKDESVLTLENSHHFHYQILDICNKLGAKVLRDYEGTSLDTLRQMVVMGMGVAFLPGLYIHSELHRPEALHVCELSNMPIVRRHSLVWRNTAPGRVFFRELAGHFREIIGQQLASAVKVLG
ncbi:hydrogen peroxide-inducible genes activator [Halioxenophilus sp. WMMB6]|uniref:hydrogen peroxide-inducible genes activator n=1 Tax=Halioxenophilus sp. WMMB6 TaxID=3073815 RepID=UPI00295EE6D0|nr:hydrogen peroxide-inducible genes activator [Halioxenophilus sp. WMMB6]